MSRNVYTPEQKAAALERLHSNGGDVVQTSLDTGVPQRTLFGWRRDLWLQQMQQARQARQMPQTQQHTPPSPPPLTAPPLHAMERGLGGEDVLRELGGEDVLRELGGEDSEDNTPWTEEQNLQVLDRIRRRLITELADLSSEGLMLTSPSQRIQALTMLLDRLMKLEQHLHPYLPVDHVLRIEYVYPDGSKHNVPPWYDGNDDADEYRRAYYPGFYRQSSPSASAEPESSTDD